MNRIDVNTNYKGPNLLKGFNFTAFKDPSEIALIQPNIATTATVKDAKATAEIQQNAATPFPVYTQAVQIAFTGTVADNTTASITAYTSVDAIPAEVSAQPNFRVSGGTAATLFRIAADSTTAANPANLTFVIPAAPAENSEYVVQKYDAAAGNWVAVNGTWSNGVWTSASTVTLARPAVMAATGSTSYWRISEQVIIPAAPAHIDLNGNKEIDIFDVAVIAASFGQPASVNPACDLNGNGEIDIFDVAVVAEYFGRSVQ